MGFLNLLFAALMVIAVNAQAAPPLEDTLLQDWDGDGQIEVVAFGDSLTRGVGDFTEPNVDVEVPNFPVTEAGYPLRLESYLGVGVQNRGVPGERISEDGVPRFSRLMQSVQPDTVLISEGANDVFIFLSEGQYFRYLQTMVNMAAALGIRPIVGTIPPPCCNHLGSRPFVDAYNRQVKRVAELNALPMFDTERAFINSCPIAEECSFLNRPEGIHPNSLGYQSMSEAVAATLFKIDLFAPDGAAKLESALGLAPGDVVTKPDPVE